MTKRKLKWVKIFINNRVIWLKREEIKDIQWSGNAINSKGKTIKQYVIKLDDGSFINGCGLEDDRIYDELIKKDLTKK